jgi:hypothetical protein
MMSPIKQRMEQARLIWKGPRSCKHLKDTQIDSYFRDREVTNDADSSSQESSSDSSSKSSSDSSSSSAASSPERNGSNHVGRKGATANLRLSESESDSDS